MPSRNDPCRSGRCDEYRGFEGEIAADLIAASGYWISDSGQFGSNFSLLSGADLRARFNVGGCIRLIERSDSALWAICRFSVCCELPFCSGSSRYASQAECLPPAMNGLSQRKKSSRSKAGLTQKLELPKSFSDSGPVL